MIYKYFGVNKKQERFNIALVQIISGLYDLILIPFGYGNDLYTNILCHYLLKRSKK